MTLARGRLVGRGTATGWWAADHERKQAIEADLAEKGLEGLERDREARRILAGHGIYPMHEKSSYNTLVNGGTAIMLDLLIAAAVTGFANANAGLGVGDSSAAFVLTQTNLQGAVNVTNRVRKATTSVTRATNVGTFVTTFLTTDANFVWNEWAIFNNATDGSGTMLNRAVTNLGTKTSASAWQLTATLTLT
jgi:hypothetical protein